MESKTKSSMLLYLKFILFLNKGMVFQFFFVILKSLSRIGVRELKRKGKELKSISWDFLFITYFFHSSFIFIGFNT